MEYPPPLPPPPPRPGNNKLLLTGCVGLVFLSAFIIVAGGRIIRSLRGPDKTVSDHLVAINKGEYSQAYGYFSPDFQKHISYKTFQMELHPFFSLLPFRSSELRHVKISDERASVEGFVTGRDGSLFPVYYELSKKNGKWKIVTYRWIFPGERISL